MIQINLAPPDVRQRRGAASGWKFRLPAMNLGMLFAAVWLVGAAATGAWWWHVAAHEADLTTQTAAAQSELTQLKAKVGQAGKVKEQVAELKKRLDTIQELTKDQSRAVVLFDALADTVPRDLWLTGMEERGSHIKITGAAFSTTAVADFMANLRASGRFKDVDIVLSRQDLAKTPRHVTFEVMCRFEVS